MFIFDLQVYSTSQQYTRHFVNMYISDKITAGEVLRIITSTKYVWLLSIVIYTVRIITSTKYVWLLGIVIYTVILFLDSSFDILFGS